MRVIALLAIGLAIAAEPVRAQTDEAPTISETLAPNHIEAARDTLTAYMIDAGALSAGSLELYQHLMPQLRTQITASEMFSRLSSERQRALAAYIETMPQIAHDEAIRGAPEVAETYAPRLAALFSEAELAGIAAFMRTPEGTSFFSRDARESARAALAGRVASATPTSSELEALMVFEASPAGRAFYERAKPLNELMYEVGLAGTAAPNITARLHRDMCEIVGENCPEWLGRIEAREPAAGDGQQHNR